MYNSPVSSPVHLEDRGATSFSGVGEWGIMNGRVGSVFYNPRARAFYQDHCSYLPAMAGWFLFSSLLSSYNKLVFGKDHMDFPCPLVLTSMHFFTQWVFSIAMCKLFPLTFGSQRVDDMSWSEFLGISVPCGLVTSGDIGLSNLSLVSISITFYTMVKASTPIFVLAWGYFFGIIHITWALIGVVLVIALGEFLTVVGEVDFVLKGFLLCLWASILSGARWTLVQLKIQKLDPPLKTSVATMRILAPFMFLTMLMVSFALEKPWDTLYNYVDSWRTGFFVFGLGFGGASLAICMILCEFYLIMHSNAVVLMIGGVIKEILTIFIGVGFFGDAINTTNFLGCCVVFAGVILYKVIHHMERKAESEHAVVPSMDRDLSEDSHNHAMNGKKERDRLQLRVDMPDSSGLDSNNNHMFLDEDSARWSEHQDGIELAGTNSLRSRGSDLSPTSRGSMLIV